MSMTLKWTLNSRHMRPHGLLKQKLQQKIAKLEMHLEHFPADAVHLMVCLERHPRKPLFKAGLTLHVPSNTLRAEKSAPDPVPAFDLAVKALLRELALLKSSLRHESQWSRSRHGAVISALAVGAPLPMGRLAAPRMSTGA